MFRALSVAAGILFLSSTCVAQFGVTTGIKVGANLATFDGADAQGFSALQEYVAGLYLDLDFPGPISLQPEILYGAKGAKARATEPSTALFRLTYIDIPLLLKYTLPIPVIEPAIYAGPSVSTLLSAKNRTEIPGQPIIETDVKSQFARSDYGIVVGASVTIGLYITELTVDARYYYGLKNLDQTGSREEYNRVATLFIGISL